MAKPKSSKYSRARIRSKVRRPKRGGASRGWLIGTIALVVVGVLLVFLSYEENQEEAAVAPIANKDHWHAYLGVNVCGTWEPTVPEFHGRNGSMSATPVAGIHSHGDFLVHVHPYASDESGDRATVGRYLGYAQSEVSTDSLQLWSNWAPGVDKTNGDTCEEGGNPGQVQWKVGQAGKPWPTKAKTGNPSDYKIRNGDIVAIYFLPKGADLEQPPGSDEALASISDLGGESAVSTVPTTAPAGTDPTSSPTAVPADSTSSTSPAGSNGTSTP